MGRRIIELIDDDWTGKQLAEGEGTTVVFSFQGSYYQMDLGDESFAKLEKLLQPWVDKALEVEAPMPEQPRRRGRAPKQGGAAANRERLALIRDWANSNGYEVAPRGRIAAEVVEAYEAAQ